MKGDKEAVGAAGIYSVGTALAVLATAVSGPEIQYSLCAIAAILSSLLFLLFMRERRFPCLLILLFFLSFAIAMTGIVCSWSSESQGLPSLPSRLARSISSTIDSLPYGDDRVPGLVKALVVGDRSGLAPGLKAAFRKSGASHLLALSGMHIGILYLIVDRLSGPLARSPRAVLVKRLLIIFASIFYTLAVGAGKSIVRACLFICLRETAGILDRPVSSIRIFSLSLIIQLFFSPLSISDPGFQLSYLAMAGIFFLYPHLERLYPEKGGGYVLKKIWDGASLSICCQIFTAPAAWCHFHTFPVHFLMTNLLAAPLMTCVMFSSLAAIVLSALGICPPLAVKASEDACRALLFVIETVSQI